MAEPGSAHGSWLVEDGVRPDWTDPELSVKRNHLAGKQLKLDLGDTTTHPASVIAESPLSDDSKELDPFQEQKREALVTDLEQMGSLVHEQVERIHQLEQALDQSLASIAELRLQLIDQQFLEAQLASTEEISNVQQQAIAQLKQQLAQQQKALETYQNQTQKKDQSFQEILESIEDLAQGQKTRLLCLRTHLYSEDDEHTASQPLDTVSDIGAEQATQRDGAIRSSALIEQLETELHRAHVALQEQQALIDTLRQSHTVKLNSSKMPLDGELLASHCKIQELETQLSRQASAQAILQHVCQELEQTRDRQQNRIAELELLNADMQEQILQQAQQASEYEAAVQHWKDRFLNSQDYLSHLKHLVEQAVTNPSEELAALLNAIQIVTTDNAEDNSSGLIPRSPKMDLPDFLLRRQRYRVRT